MDTCSAELLCDDFYKTLLDSIFDAVYTVGSDGKITYWNDSCSRITGYSAQEVIGQLYSDVPFAHNMEKTDSAAPDGGVDIVLKTGMPGTWKGFVQRKNGQRIPVESHISAIRDKLGDIIGAVEVFRDISAHVSLEQAHRQLLHFARKDQLTGLYNRAATSELLKAEVERSSRYQQPLSVVMVDIDHFKRINDLYGHDSGDKVLAKIGNTFTFNLRNPDTMGRWGGEEFLIIAPGSDAQAAANFAERLRVLIEEIPLTEVPEQITASFGVAQLTKGQIPDKLLFQADQALYKAKETGRNKVVIADFDQKGPENQ